MRSIQAELAELQQQIATIDDHEIAVYEKLRQRVKVERQIFRTLQEQAQADRQEQLLMMLDFAVSGTLLSLKDKNITATSSITVLLVDKITTSSSQIPYLICLGKDNYWYVVTASDVVDIYGEVPRVDVPLDINLPSDILLKRGQIVPGDKTTLPLLKVYLTQENISIYLQK